MRFKHRAQSGVTAKEGQERHVAPVKAAKHDLSGVKHDVESIAGSQRRHDMTVDAPVGHGR
jgi:hypothetical protein